MALGNGDAELKGGILLLLFSATEKEYRTFIFDSASRFSSYVVALSVFITIFVVFVVVFIAFVAALILVVIVVKVKGYQIRDV